MQTRFCYVISKPGSDLDGEDTIIRAERRVDADADAERRRKAWGCESMKFIGRREGHRFIAMVPADELPEWALDLVPCPSCKDASCMLCDDNGMVSRVKESA